METHTCFSYNCKNTAISNLVVKDKTGLMWIFYRDFCGYHLQGYWNEFGERVFFGNVIWIEKILR